MSDWLIRYDIVCRPAGAEWHSACNFPMDKQGFETLQEANEVLNRLKRASSELGPSKQPLWDIWVMAVHKEAGVMSFDMDVGDTDDDDDLGSPRPRRDN